MVLPAIPWILGALGGGLLMQWAGESDDEWGDSEVFNSRMREIHVGILQLNTLISKCKTMTADVDSWRQLVNLWSQFYREIGSVWLDPSDSAIFEAKRFAARLAQFIDAYQVNCGELPTGMMPVNVEKKPPKSPWIGVVLGLGAIGGAAWIIASVLNRPRPQ